MESTAPATGCGDSAASGPEPPSSPLAPQQAAAADGGGDTGSTSSATLLYLAGVGQAVGTDMEVCGCICVCIYTSIDLSIDSVTQLCNRLIVLNWSTAQQSTIQNTIKTGAAVDARGVRGLGR